MHTKIHSVLGSKSLQLFMALGLLVLLLTAPVLTASAQVEDVRETIFQTLIALPDAQLAQLVDFTAVLNEAPDMVDLFLEAPRDFLFSEGIELPPDAFQITGVNFLLPPAIEDDPWFGVAEALEGYLYGSKGLGIFYSNVGIVIQEAYEPLDEEIAIAETNHQFDMLVYIDERFQGETLNLIRDVMRELEELDAEDPKRLEFLANPREYLVDQNLTLPAHSYRIIAIDMNRAEAAGSVISDQIRPGMGTVKEGIGVFLDNVGIFLQRAI